MPTGVRPCTTCICICWVGALWRGLQGEPRRASRQRGRRTSATGYDGVAFPFDACPTPQRGGLPVSSDLKIRLREDLTTARKARDKLRTLVLSTVLSEVRNKEIDQRSDLDDDGVLQVISKGIKQRKDAAEQMRAAGREELAKTEDSQSAVLAEYLPEGLSEDEVRALVRQAIADGADQMGALMGRIMPQIRGRFDGKEANRIVREELEG
ncbi:MAG TPA: GatB/YqeY domain-containing protein [Gemmatimonadetes bacterium]|nr:hypothetical protein [Gemmatimonadota bacterium]HIC55163.1 GatB/YqeY domain-containing protein [Gemmatimonadota bacterium]